MEQENKSPGSAATLTEARDYSHSAKYTNTQEQTQADFEIEGEPLALIPPGDYQVQFVGWWTGIMFARQPKVGLTFKIVQPGAHFGVKITRWYNARRLIGKHGKSGRFKIGRRSDFLADYARLFGMPTRTDRFSFTRLERLILLVRVDTVGINHRQRQINEKLQYSVVRELLHVVAGEAREHLNLAPVA